MDGRLLLITGSVGLVALPGSGKWYVGEFEAPAFLTRLIGGFVVLGSLRRECGGGATYACRAEPVRPIFYSGLAMIGTGALWDIATAGRAAKRHRRATR